MYSVVPDREWHDTQPAMNHPDPRNPSANPLPNVSVPEDLLEETQDHDPLNESSGTDEGGHPDSLAVALEATTSSSAKSGTMFYSGKQHDVNASGEGSVNIPNRQTWGVRISQ
jgi:hypothetical protein